MAELMFSSFQNDGSYLFSLVLQFLSMELCQRTLEMSAFRPTHLREVVRPHLRMQRYDDF